MSFFVLSGYLGHCSTVLQGSWEQVGILLDFGTVPGTTKRAPRTKQGMQDMRNLGLFPSR